MRLPSDTPSHADIVGSWQLVEWAIWAPSVRGEAPQAPHHPFGTDAQGSLLYTADGRMSASIAQAARAPMAHATPRAASAQAKACAFDSFFHYAGRYELQFGKLVHYVQYALNPNMVGTTQIRELRWPEPKLLELSALEPRPGASSAADARRHVLLWRRIDEQQHEHVTR